MNTSDISDYLSPVANAGDSIYFNGEQEKVVTKEEERKAEELIKQIALKKQLDLQRGDPTKIREMLNQDTPEAAIYRALLLQQLEKNKGEGKKEEEEEEKPGVVRRVAGWIGKTALGTAKYMGYMALRYLAWKAIRNAGDIYRDGPMKTWKKWQLESGVARTPELAEKFGDEYAALGDDIVDRSVSLSEMTKDQQKKAIAYADEIFGKKVNTNGLKFDLMGVFKNNDTGEYVDSLPKGADADDYTKEFGYFINTGKKGDPLLPVNKDDFGSQMFDSIFKKGKVNALITPENNWFTGNPFIRTLDNEVYHIGELTGYNERTRENNVERYEPPSRRKMEEEKRKKEEEEKMKKMAEEDKKKKEEEEKKKKEEEEKKKKSNPDDDDGEGSLEDRIWADRMDNVHSTFSNLAGNSNAYGWFVDNHFKYTPKTVLKALNMIEGKNYTDEDLYQPLFDMADVNYTEGIRSGDLAEFMGKAALLKRYYSRPGQKKELLKRLENLINQYNDSTYTVLPHKNPSLKPTLDLKENRWNINTGNIASNAATILGVSAAAYEAWKVLHTTSEVVKTAAPVAAALAGGYRFPKRRLRKSTSKRAHLKKTTKDGRRKRR